MGYALSWTSALPLAACLLIGAIVSTTDPSAVVTIFRSISAPRRLARIIEGESLLNDAAAIALFGLFMGFVMLGLPDPDLGQALVRFPLLIAGGRLHRAGPPRAWRSGSMALFGRYELAQISISVALPYLAYIAAEQMIGALGRDRRGRGRADAEPDRPGPPAAASLDEPAPSFGTCWPIGRAHLIFILGRPPDPPPAGKEVPPPGPRRPGVGRFRPRRRFVILAAIAARAIIPLRPPAAAHRAEALARPRWNPAPYRVATPLGGAWAAARSRWRWALAVTESFRVPDGIQRVVGILCHRLYPFSPPDRAGAPRCVG